jgi:hypothetical protein
VANRRQLKRYRFMQFWVSVVLIDRQELLQMIKRMLAALACVAFCAGGLSASAKTLVREFSGTGMATTAEFEVRAPWILDWLVNSDYQGSLAIEVSLVDAKTGFQSGLILQTKRPGNGVRLFNQSGKYRLRVSSTLARWQLKVEQITAAEAESYKPK